jgi:hypothetical protein
MVRDEQGTIPTRATLPTEANAILGLVRGLGPRVHVSFEESTQAQWLHDLSAKKRTVIDNRFHRTLRCTGLGAATCGIASRHYFACGSKPVSLDPLRGHARAIRIPTSR